MSPKKKAPETPGMPDFIRREFEGMRNHFLRSIRERKTSGDLLDVSVTGDWWDRHMDNVDYRVVKCMMWAYLVGTAEARLDSSDGHEFLEAWLEELRTMDRDAEAES